MPSDERPAAVRVHGDGAAGASRLAGALAELGITTLVLMVPGCASRTLVAREIDLPGVLLGAPPGTVLESRPVAVRVTVDASGFRCEAGDEGVRRQLEKALGG